MPEQLPPKNLTVVKVGGSLLELPDLGPRLRAWLATQETGSFLLVPGGGTAADVIRRMDNIHGLGEEAAHWLALRALTLNAYVLQRLLGKENPLTPSPSPPRGEGIFVLDPFAFAVADEHRPGALPHCWEATSDAVALRAALVSGAGKLVLLKSASLPEGLNWPEAARRGFVDAVFPELVKQAGNLSIEAINFRQWQPG